MGEYYELYFGSSADNNTNDYELYHHGVKGQKWGVRKDRKKLERRYTKAVKSGNDFNISKGSPIYRATNTKAENFNNRAYATLKRTDAARYATSDVLGQPFDYVDTYRAKDPLNVAGYTTAANVLNKTYSLGLEKTKAGENMFDVQDKFVNTDDPKKLKAADAFMKEPEYYSPYKKALMKKGYDAVVDLVDMGEYADTPIILLDNKKIRRGKQFVSQDFLYNDLIYDNDIWGT